MEEQALILALDIGTSSTRAILYDARGTAVPELQVQRKYQLTTSHEGEASVDADSLVDLVVRTIDELLQKAGTRAQKIAAVATSAFWHTLLPLDASGRPLLPLMTWEDTRPQQAALALGAQLDETAVHRRTGARLHSSYWPAKLTWLARVHPDIVRQTARYVSFGEYLHERLLGRAVCSLSMASGTGLLNLSTQNWDRDLLTFLRIPASHLPQIGDVHDTLQGLVHAFADRWPMLNRVPWLPAIGDGAAANLGSNCADPSTWAITIGTSSAIRVVVPPQEVTVEQGLWLYSVDRKRALLGGALSEGGNMMVWLKNTLQIPERDNLDAQLASIEPAAHGLTILPQLAGERSPGWHAHASMTISGLTIHTTPLEIARAALEAVVLQLSLIYDQLLHTLAHRTTHPRLIASGGALLNSPLLSQMLADTLNRPLELCVGHEASARGVALLALEALGMLPNLTRFAPGTVTMVEPDSARHPIYQRARERQQALYHLFFPILT